MKDHLTCSATAKRRAPGKPDISNPPGTKPAVFAMTALMGAVFNGLTLPAEAPVYWQGQDDFYVPRRIERNRHHIATRETAKRN